MKGYVDDLAGFSKATYKGITYRLESVGKKTLEIAIPPVEMTSGQAKVFNEIMDYAKEKGIKIITKIVE